MAGHPARFIRAQLAPAFRTSAELSHPEIMLRSLLQSLSRGVVLRRRLPPEFGRGRIYVTPDSRLRLWRLRMDRVEDKLLCLAAETVRDGSVVWDIGANIELFNVRSVGSQKNSLATDERG
jgi:hypothetical protein